MTTPFKNNDQKLIGDVERVLRERKIAGLEGLIGGLEAVIINTQPDLLGLAARELLANTGLQFAEAFGDDDCTTYVLKAPAGADFLLRSRAPGAPNPFSRANNYPVGKRLPDTRLETFVFTCHDLKTYHMIQKDRGITFLTPTVLDFPDFYFLQTEPSLLTGNSTGFVQWKTAGSRNWRSGSAHSLDRRLEKPDFPFLKNIGRLDHCATRVRAQQRDAAILEFLVLTNYHFDFAVYVESLNSITNVSRLGAQDFALVFTSGISPFVDEETSGPTEKFAHTHGPRVHHMAFDCGQVEEVVEGLRLHGQRYLANLVGSRNEGLRQIFSVPSRSTLLVNEYIQRFDGFDGFFTKSNVTHLTRATIQQD
jgi:hypothetical protein